MKTLRIILVALIALAAGTFASGHAQRLLLTLDSPNPQAWAYFGRSVAVGDVNGDGKGDIAVGAPQETVDGRVGQGRAYVFSGADGALLFTLDTPNPQSALFGQSLAVGDVNDDGKADIAVGAPGETGAQGRVYVFSGSDASLLLTLDTPNPQVLAWFGAAVAMGEVNGDGKADIAVTARGEAVGGNADQGRVYVFSGADGSLLLTLDTPNPQVEAYFGHSSAAVGDVNGDGTGDIVAGAHGEQVGLNDYQGRAYVFSGTDGSLLYTLDTPNPQVEAVFGYSVAVADLTGDGKADIIVGAHRENVGGNADQGRVYVFSGADASLLSTLDTPNPQAFATFGVPLAVGDVNADGTPDIAVSAQMEDVDEVDQGRAYVYSGANLSLLLTLDTPNPKAGAVFGASLAVGDVHGDGNADIAAGADREDVGGNQFQGRAYVFSADSDGDGLMDDVDLDDDGDGYTDVNESDKGSEPLDSGSTPEHCDGLDNDGDDPGDGSGVDEGFPDSDGDTVKDCVDPDHPYYADDDDDDDGYEDVAEGWMSTDEQGDCPDGSNPWGAPEDDAWPPDIDMNTVVDVTDALKFLGVFPTAEGEPNYSKRLDMAQANGAIDVTDALVFLNEFPGACTNP